MNNIIPIFIHHETGEKKQAGGNNMQKYLKYCIEQAEKYGNTVYLFGDDTNKGWAKNWIDVKSIYSNKWENFLNVFENFSTYPDAWAKGIFHRFFLFEEYAKENNIDSFFVLDSDILVYANLEELYDWRKIDFAAIAPQQNQLGYEIENNLRWTINAGISYWKSNAVENFTSYCVDTYKNHKDILKPKWEFHKKYSYAGGICEMSLLYLWVKNNKNIKFLNLANKDFKGGTFNLDISGSENYKRKEFKCSPLLGIKKVNSQNGNMYLTTTDRKKVIIYNLHFVGDAKMLMYDYFTYNQLTTKMCIKYSLYNFKKNMGQKYRLIKRNISKLQERFS